MDKYRFEQAILESMERSCVPFAIYQFIDRRVVTLVLSEGFCRLFGYDDREAAYELMDNDMYRDTHPDDVSRTADAAVRFATSGGSYNVAYRTRRAGQEDYIVIHAQGEHVYTETGVRLAVIWYTNEGVFAPEGDRYESELSHSFTNMLREGSLIHRQHYDALTGLPNMTYFFELAEAGRRRLIEQGQQPALLYFNLNGMKFYNRKYGFSEGDKLINGVARALVRYFSNENCCRFAQDHFAVYTCAEGLEERLWELFEDCKGLNSGNSLPVRVGVYLEQMGAVEIAVACDRAKYACDRDRNAYTSGFRYFNEAMLLRVENQQYIVNNIDRAIQEKWIRVFYQPIIRSTNGRVCDEEALARWFDPVKGVLLPSEFIPALEDARLVYKLDIYVLDQILEKMKRQADAGLYVVPQSLNLSRADFDTCDIVEEIRRRVDEAGIARNKLTVELTESIVGSDFEFMKKQIERLRELGFAVWMDDFGSGYSTLDVLHTIRFDLIKFDMRFMQRFGEGDESKIILTELINMAISLGIDTVAEGVETAEQVDFLREVGCSKLQGFFYCRAIPPEEIVERNRKGIQIGYENPAESDYFAVIGRINLHDLTRIAREERETLQQYFNTIPMAILERSGETFSVVRCNQSYREYIHSSGEKAGAEDRIARLLRSAAQQDSGDGGLIVIEEETGAGETTHAMIKRIAENPVTGKVSLAVAILSVEENKNRITPASYAHIAKALSSDYRSLYYVNLDTEHFIEYSSDPSGGYLALERHGESFFAASRSDARLFLHEADRENFIRTFTKETVIRAIDKHGAFTLTYRLFVDGEPRYVNMKAVRMSANDDYIIVGVNDVDAQMKQQEVLRRIRAEQATYARLMALSDEYICIISVDPVTERYVEYSATQDYEGLGLAKRGEKFFRRAREQSVWTLHPDDQDRFASAFTKERVIREIQANKHFVLDYRLMIDGKPVNVRLKAALVEESDGPQLIFGVSNIEAQLAREREYAELSAALADAGREPPARSSLAR